MIPVRAFSVIRIYDIWLCIFDSVTGLYSFRHLDYDYFIDMFYHLTKGSPTKGYKRRMERHNQYYNSSNT